MTVPFSDHLEKCKHNQWLNPWRCTLRVFITDIDSITLLTSRWEDKRCVIRVALCVINRGIWMWHGSCGGQGELLVLCSQISHNSKIQQMHCGGFYLISRWILGLGFYYLKKMYFLLKRLFLVIKTDKFWKSQKQQSAAPALLFLEDTDWDPW